MRQGMRHLLRKKRLHLTRDHIRNSRPLRNPALEWEKNEQGQVVITLRRRSDRKTKILAALFVLPKQRQIVLDDVGTLVWEMCDGETTVAAITQELVTTHKLNHKEAELSLGQFFRQLTKRGFVGLQVAEEKKT